MSCMLNSFLFGHINSIGSSARPHGMRCYSHRRLYILHDDCFFHSDAMRMCLRREYLFALRAHAYSTRAYHSIPASALCEKCTKLCMKLWRQWPKLSLLFYVSFCFSSVFSVAFVDVDSRHIQSTHNTSHQRVSVNMPRCGVRVYAFSYARLFKNTLTRK